MWGGCCRLSLNFDFLNPAKGLLLPWRAKFPEALALWSKFTRLREPIWCLNDGEAMRQGLTESFAMIRLTDHSIVINLKEILDKQLQDYALEILAHEIGHHVYCPADLTDNARMLARMRWALPTQEMHAAFIGNLYTDLLINNRLQRDRSLRIADVYLALERIQGKDAITPRMWTFYMRLYEILWSIEKGKLARGTMDARLEGDAYLGARLIRSYAREWLDGSGRFAALCLPYLQEDDAEAIQRWLKAWRDTQSAGAGGLPDGLTEIEPGEKEGAIHPAMDDELSGVDKEDASKKRKGATAKPQEAAQPVVNSGQRREPFEYGAILKQMGIDLDDHEIAMRYYREAARKYLVKFPTREVPQATDPLPEGLEPWHIGSPLENLDLISSIQYSPHIIPGLTTLERVYGTSSGSLPETQPLDLDLYVDSSGSMPNPQYNISYPALAGAIIVLSALRAGARVQATLWSGARQFTKTDGFVRDENALLKILTGFIGGGTAFPLHVLRETYAQRKPNARPVHILIISDNGVTTMYNKDERNEDGGVIARTALEKAQGGGTMALNLYPDWEQHETLLLQARTEGWQIFPVNTLEGLVAFAKAFSQMKYGK